MVLRSAIYWLIFLFFNFAEAKNFNQSAINVIACQKARMYVTVGYFLGKTLVFILKAKHCFAALKLGSMKQLWFTSLITYLMKRLSLMRLHLFMLVNMIIQ